MQINIEINDGLMAKAQKLSNIENKSVLIEKALQLLVAIENQKG
jgi:Arc/MetJ family transcription regulator